MTASKVTAVPCHSESIEKASAIAGSLGSRLYCSEEINRPSFIDKFEPQFLTVLRYLARTYREFCVVSTQKLPSNGCRQYQLHALRKSVNLNRGSSGAVTRFRSLTPRLRASVQLPYRDRLPFPAF